MTYENLPIQGQVSAAAAKRFDAPLNYGQPRCFNGHAWITGPCGDTMEFWLQVESEQVVQVGFTTTGCGPSRAAGSMATELASGQHVEEALEIEQATILRMLGGLPSESEHCALLAANTLKAALEDFRRRGRQEDNMDLE